MAKEANCRRICVDRPNSPTCNGHPGYISATCVIGKVDNHLERVSSIDIRSLAKYNVIYLQHSSSITPEDHLHISNITYIIHLTPYLPLSYAMRTRILFVTVTIYQDVSIIFHEFIYIARNPF